MGEKLLKLKSYLERHPLLGWQIFAGLGSEKTKENKTMRKINKRYELKTKPHKK